VDGTLNGRVDPRFGRARYFVVFDDATGESTVHDNSTNLAAAQGAGIQAAQTVAELGVGAVLTGNVGPKAFTVLEKAGIDVYTGVADSVQDALAAFRSGALARVFRPTVEGRWQ